MKRRTLPHILLWWHGDRSQLSPQYQDFVTVTNADSPLVRLRHHTMGSAHTEGIGRTDAAHQGGAWGRRTAAERS